jgi:hypothetical protein
MGQTPTKPLPKPGAASTVTPGASCTESKTNEGVKPAEWEAIPEESRVQVVSALQRFVESHDLLALEASLESGYVSIPFPSPSMCTDVVLARGLPPVGVILQSALDENGDAALSGITLESLAPAVFALTTYNSGSEVYKVFVSGQGYIRFVIAAAKLVRQYTGDATPVPAVVLVKVLNAVRMLSTKVPNRASLVVSDLVPALVPLLQNRPKSTRYSEYNAVYILHMLASEKPVWIRSDLWKLQSAILSQYFRALFSVLSPSATVHEHVKAVLDADRAAVLPSPRPPSHITAKSCCGFFRAAVSSAITKASCMEWHLLQVAMILSGAVELCFAYGAHALYSINQTSFQYFLTLTATETATGSPPSGKSLRTFLCADHFDKDYGSSLGLLPKHIGGFLIDVAKRCYDANLPELFPPRLLRAMLLGLHCALSLRSAQRSDTADATEAKSSDDGCEPPSGASLQFPSQEKAAEVLLEFVKAVMSCLAIVGLRRPSLLFDATVDFPSVRWSDRLFTAFSVAVPDC